MTGHGRYLAHVGPAWGAPGQQEPAAASAESNAPANTPGIRHITFAVEDIEDILARLHAHGAELVGELEQYEDSYRLCYVRGPEGIIVVSDPATVTAIITAAINGSR
nr:MULTISPECIES: VOC family protein [unclassified Frankia]